MINSQRSIFLGPSHETFFQQSLHEFLRDRSRGFAAGASLLHDDNKRDLRTIGWDIAREPRMIWPSAPVFGGARLARDGDFFQAYRLVAGPLWV